MGKSAIEAPRKSIFMVEPERLVIVTDPSHPLYDERAEWEPNPELVASVISDGVMEPVEVRKNGEDLEVVFGRQRTKAALAANKRLVAAGKDPIRVPTMVIRTEDGVAQRRAVSENELRQSDTPMTRARKIQRFLSQGHTIKEAEIAFGRSRPVIEGLQKLLNLSADMQRKVESGEVSVSAAVQFADLPKQEQKTALDDLVKQTGGRVSQNRAKKAKAQRKQGKRKANGGQSQTKLTSVSKVRLRKVYSIVNVSAHETGPVAAPIIAVLGWVIGEYDDEDLASHVKGFGKVFKAEEARAKKAAARATKKKGGKAK